MHGLRTCLCLNPSLLGHEWSHCCFIMGEPMAALLCVNPSLLGHVWTHRCLLICKPITASLCENHSLLPHVWTHQSLAVCEPRHVWTHHYLLRRDLVLARHAWTHCCLITCEPISTLSCVNSLLPITASFSWHFYPWCLFWRIILIYILKQFKSVHIRSKLNNFLNSSKNLILAGRIFSEASNSSLSGYSTW